MGLEENWEASDELREYIRTILPLGKTILELGSGSGTAKLAEHYKMISIEHSQKWLGKHDTTYIHAPIEPFRKQCEIFPEDKGWYNRGVLRRVLPCHWYDLLLIDGPPNEFGRGGFYKWKELFDLNVPMIFDDVHRKRELRLITRMSAHVKRPFTVHAAWTPKHFGVILP